jgi:DNA-binding response OmpR family regulator
MIRTQPPRKIAIATIKADLAWLRSVQDTINHDHVEIHNFRDQQQGLRFIDTAFPEIVALGLGIPEFDALGTLERIFRASTQVQMAVLTVPECINNAIEVTTLGPAEYKTRPLSLRDLCDRIWSMRYRVGK